MRPPIPEGSKDESPEKKLNFSFYGINIWKHAR